MRLTLTNNTVIQKLSALAARDRLPIHVLAEQLLGQALATVDVPFIESKPKAVDRNAAQVLSLLRGNTGGLTVHDICGINGWCYLTATKVMRHMVEQGLVDRERIPTCGAPAWSYTARPTAVPAAGAETPAADASTSGNGDLSLL